MKITKVIWMTMGQRLSKAEIVERCRLTHGDKYDYSEFLKEDFEYKNLGQKIPFICHETNIKGKEHGIFWMDLYHFARRGQGCPICAIKRRSEKISKILKGRHEDNDKWVSECNEKHCSKYDYSLVDLGNRNSDGKVPIICHELDDNGKEHGIFWQRPNQHKFGKGCPKCRYLTNDEIIKRAKKIHGENTFDYSLLNYEGKDKKVDIKCNTCGNIFKTLPHNLLSGRGCPYCHRTRQNEVFKMPQDEVIKRINNVFNGKYDTSKVEYVNRNIPIKLICPIHGEFEQKSEMLFKGHGCKLCGQSALENEIQVFLDKNGIESEYEKKFKWLGTFQSLDFYLPQYNVAIECQGIQHFKPTSFGRCSIKESDEKFKLYLERDERKRKLCEENGIKLLYYSNLGIDYPYHVFEDKNELLNEIIT